MEQNLKSQKNPCLHCLILFFLLLLATTETDIRVAARGAGARSAESTAGFGEGIRAAAGALRLGAILVGAAAEKLRARLGAATAIVVDVATGGGRIFVATAIVVAVAVVALEARATIIAAIATTGSAAARSGRRSTTASAAATTKSESLGRRLAVAVVVVLVVGGGSSLLETSTSDLLFLDELIE